MLQDVAEVADAAGLGVLVCACGAAARHAGTIYEPGAGVMHQSPDAVIS